MHVLVLNVVHWTKASNRIPANLTDWLHTPSIHSYSIVRTCCSSQRLLPLFHALTSLFTLIISHGACHPLWGTFHPHMANATWPAWEHIVPASQAPKGHSTLLEQFLKHTMTLTKESDWKLVVSSGDYFGTNCRLAFLRHIACLSHSSRRNTSPVH